MRQNTVNFFRNISFFSFIGFDRFLINFGNKIVTRKDFTVCRRVVRKAEMNVFIFSAKFIFQATKDRGIS